MIAKTYSTVPTDALNILTGTVPLDIKVREQCRAYDLLKKVLLMSQLRAICPKKT